MIAEVIEMHLDWRAVIDSELEQRIILANAAYLQARESGQTIIDLDWTVLNVGSDRRRTVLQATVVRLKS